MLPTIVADVMPLVTPSTTAHPIHTLSPSFASFTIDVGSILGCLWHAHDEPFPYDSVRNLSRHLAPAYLRVGGTDADHVYYNLTATSASEFAHYGTTACDGVGALNTSALSALASFAFDLNVTLVFGLNGGGGPRSWSTNGEAWTADNARELIQWTAAKYPTLETMWELGNEPNLYFESAHVVSGKQLAADFRTLASVASPTARLAGVDAAYQFPWGGELLPTTNEFAIHNGSAYASALTYHFYPLLGKRLVPFSDVWLATPERAVSERVFARSARVMGGVAAIGAAHGFREVWLGEFALAAFGGAANVSDAWVGTFYYLETLGHAARLGLGAVMRQDLSGARYGLIDRATLTPCPDYWAVLLWKRLMGTGVLAPTREPGGRALRDNDDDADGEKPAGLRTYAHCVPGGGSGGATLLFINASPKPALTRLNASSLRSSTLAYVATAHDAADPLHDASRIVLLGGRPLAAGPGGRVPIEGAALESYGWKVKASGEVEVPAWAWAFVSPLEAEACA